MQNINTLTRSWSDTLTVLSVGAIAFLAFNTTKVGTDGSLTISLSEISAYSAFVEDLTATTSILVGIVVLSLLMAFGFFLIQFGELIAIATEWKEKGYRSRKRVEKCIENPALMMMFSNAYTSFRLLCGFGGILVAGCGQVLFIGLTSQSINTVVIGLSLGFSGWIIVAWFARYSFSHLDWIIFGDLRE